MKSYRSWRRQRLANQIVANGELLRRFRVERGYIDGSYDHTQPDALYLDERINNVERRHERLLKTFKETA